MNVLMVYPRFPSETFWGMQHMLPFLRKKAIMPPLALTTVAAMLPRDWEIFIIDENTGLLLDDDLEWADICMITAMDIQQEAFYRVVRRASKAGCNVVVGGPYASIFRDDIEREVPGMVNTFFDGECEETLPEWLEDMRIGTPKKLYQSARKSNQILVDVARSPIPMFELLGDDYAMQAIQVTRGCHWACAWCVIDRLNGRVPRIKTPEQVVAELEALYSLGRSGHVFLVDDNFVGNRGKLEEVLKAVIAWQKDHGFPFSFFTEASADLAKHPQLMELMVEAGFNHVFIGIESLGKLALEISDKGQNLDSTGQRTPEEFLLGVVRTIQGAGMQVSGGFIIGLDGDSVNDFRRLVPFIEEAGINMAMAGLIVAERGTKFWQSLEETGREPRPFATINTGFTTINFRTKLPPEVLTREYIKVISQLYDPTLEKYFRRCLTTLRHLGSGNKMVGFMAYRGWGMARILLMSILKIGFSRMGPAYFRFIANVWREKPQAIPTAFSMAIIGYHFARVTKSAVGEYLALKEVSSTGATRVEQV